MNNKTEQKNSKRMDSFRFISEVINNISILFSFVAISLFGGIFFGLADTLDYRYLYFMNECAHCLVIAAVVFYVLGIILWKWTKEDSKETNLVIYQINGKKGIVLERRPITNINSAVSPLSTEKSKCDKKSEQNTAHESSKSTKNSPKSIKLAGTLKRDKIYPRTSLLTISSKTTQQTATSKQAEISSKALSSSTSSQTEKSGACDFPQNAQSSLKALLWSRSPKTVKSDASPQKKEIATKTSSKEILSILPQNGVSKQKEICSRNSRPKATQQLNEKVPYINDKQLVPYKTQLESSISEKLPFQNRNFRQNSMLRQSEINSIPVRPNTSSENLIRDIASLEVELTPKTTSSSPAIPRPIGPPKKRKVHPGTLQSLAETLSSSDKQSVSQKPWFKTPGHERKIPVTSENPFNQSSLSICASEYQRPSESFPYADYQLFPYSPPIENSVHTENIPVSNIPFYQNFAATYAFGNIPTTGNFRYADYQPLPHNSQIESCVSEQNMPENPIIPLCQNLLPSFLRTTEIIATKKVTVFPGGVAQSQEEYRMHQMAVSPDVGSEIQRPHSGSASDQRKSQPISEESDENKISDVQTKFESMNMQ